MLRMSCNASENEAAPEMSSNLADLLQIREGEDTYGPEKWLEGAILEKCISVTANGEEKVGFVVEVKVEPRGVVIDFAGAYFLEVARDKISDIHFVTEADVEEYFGTFGNKNNQPFNFEAVKNRIHKTLSN